MAAKTNWHRCESKLRYCRPMPIAQINLFDFRPFRVSQTLGFMVVESGFRTIINKALTEAVSGILAYLMTIFDYSELKQLQDYFTQYKRRRV